MKKYLLLCIYFFSAGVFGLQAQAYPEPPELAREVSDIISIYSSSLTNTENKNKNQAPINGSYVTTPLGKNIIMTRESDSRIRVDHTTIDVSGQTHLHFDMYSVSQPQYSASVTDASYVTLTKTVTSGIQTGEWIGYDIPLSELTSSGSADLTHIIRFGGGTRHSNYPGTYYFDNIYYYNTATTSIGDDENGSASRIFFDAGNKDKLIIESNENIRTLKIYNISGKLLKSAVVNASNSIIDVNNLQSGVYIVSVAFGEGKTSTQKIIK